MHPTPWYCYRLDFTSISHFQTQHTLAETHEIDTQLLHSLDWLSMDAGDPTRPQDMSGQAGLSPVQYDEVRLADSPHCLSCHHAALLT